MRKKSLLMLVLMCFIILSAWSGTVEAAGIEAPSGLTAAVISATQIDLSWTDNSGSEDGFKIERTSGSSSTEFTVAQNVTSFSDTGLAPYTTYSYRVRAYAGADNSGYSNTASATTPGPPAAPSNLEAVIATSSQVDLTWEDNAIDESGYSIERKTGAGDYVEISTVGANTTGFSDTGLTTDTAYSYRVQAFNTVGNSGYSNDITITIIALPSAPTGLTATVNTSSPSSIIDLSWHDTSNETGYKIERKTEGGSYSQISTVGADITSYSNTGMATGTKYFYQVRAYNSAGDSAYSSAAYATTTTTGYVPDEPDDLTATAVSSSRIDLTWNNVSNETGYKIERKKSGGSYSQIATVRVNTTSYSNTGLSSDTKYYYRVRAYNSYGYSSYSNEDYATTTTTGDVPDEPDDLTATAVSSSRIDLTWENVSNETGYKIERKKSGGSYSQIATVRVNTTSYSNTGLSTGTKYYYRVRAYNSYGNSAYSNEDYATTTSQSTSSVIKLTIGNSTYYVNGKSKTMDTSAIIKENRTLLPIRYVAEGIGATVTWDGSTSKVTVTLKDKLLELWIGQNKARVNGQYMLIDDTNSSVTPIIVPPGRTMLPVRFIAESLGSKVDWDKDLMQATVTYPAP